MTEKNKNRAIGRQVRKMIAAAMAAMLVFTSVNVTDADAAETVPAVSENTTIAETEAVEAEKDTESNTGRPDVENSGAENSGVETTDLEAETADAHTYENGFCIDSGCDAYEPAVLTTDKYDMNGNGEKDEAYEIGNAGQLYWFAGLVNGTLTDGTAQNLKANAVLTEDITVNANLLASIKTDEDGNATSGISFKVWRPMGILSTDGKWKMEYAGIFDGDGHSISGLYVNMDELSDERVICFGLFGFFAGVTRNLRILDSYMKGDYYIGGICGFNDGGTIQNCANTAIVYGKSYIGGISGRSLNNSIIENCYNAGNVYGDWTCVGGICGDNFSTIENSYNVRSIKGNNEVGGIVGYSSESGNIIKDCYNRGNVTGVTETIVLVALVEISVTVWSRIVTVRQLSVEISR